MTAARRRPHHRYMVTLVPLLATTSFPTASPSSAPAWSAWPPPGSSRSAGVEVTVLDREGVAAGSSWGNAGWLTPGLATPLPEPAVLKYGVRAVLSPASPVYVPPTASPRLPQVPHPLRPQQHRRTLEDRDGRAGPDQPAGAERFDLLAKAGVEARDRTRPSRSSPPTAPPTSARCCSRRSSTSTPPARTSSSTPSPATRPARSSRRCPTRSARRSGCTASGSSTPATTSTLLADSVIARGGKIVTGVDVEARHRRRRSAASGVVTGDGETDRSTRS